MTQKQKTVLNGYCLNYDGLKISFTKGGEKSTTTYDPKATCDLFKEIGYIEDFTFDKNGEPVILFTDNSVPPGYGYELWCNFIKSFPGKESLFLNVIEYKEERKAFKKLQTAINYIRYQMYHPQKIAAA